MRNKQHDEIDRHVACCVKGLPSWRGPPPRRVGQMQGIRSMTHEHRHLNFFANKAKTEVRHFSLKLYKIIGGAPEGPITLLRFPSAPDPLFKASKAPFLTRRVATPSGVPCQAPLVKTRCTPVKQDRKLPAQKTSKEWSAPEIGTRSRDTNVHSLRPQWTR